jgi:hypothetical protein
MKDELEDAIARSCREALEMVLADLEMKYSDLIFKNGSEIVNAVTGEKFNVTEGKMRPLEIAARLVSEDLNILLPLNKLNNGKYILSNSSDHVDGFHLVASATLFPAGWVLKDRIGWTIQELHAPVPLWKDNLGQAVSNALKKAAFGVTQTGKEVVDTERLAVFPQTDRPGATLSDLLFTQDGGSFFPTQPLEVDKLFLLRERQCFRRMKADNGVLFSVRTYIVHFRELEPSEAEAFAQQAQKLRDSHAAYKQRRIWYPCVRRYLWELGISLDTNIEA